MVLCIKTTIARVYIDLQVTVQLVQLLQHRFIEPLVLGHFKQVPSEG